MATEKVSLTLDDELVAEARSRVGRRGLSAYVNAALSRQLQRDRLETLLAEMDAEAGPVPVELLKEARRVWPDRGRAKRRRRA